MDRDAIVRRIGYGYRTTNIEAGEYSYVQAAGSKSKLISLLGYEPQHFKFDDFKRFLIDLADRKSVV